MVLLKELAVETPCVIVLLNIRLDVKVWVGSCKKWEFVVLIYSQVNQGISS